MPPHNLKGKGIWIGQIPRCENGDLGAIVARAARAGFSHVVLKISDGDDDYQVWNGRDLAAELLPRLVQAGLTVWGWSRIYGDPPARDAGKPQYWQLEAQRIVQRAKQLRPLGLSGLMLNAEREYETIIDRHNKAAECLQGVRAGLRDLPLALAAWKFPSQHRGFAWDALRGAVDADAPQVYWTGAHDPAEQLKRAQKEFASLTPQRPCLPVGPGFREANWRPTAQELTAFLEQCVALGLPAASLWAWDQLGLRGNEAHNTGRLNFTAEWEAVAAFAWPGAAPARRAAPEAPALPPDADVAQRLITALNTADPDQVLALYAANAGLATPHSSVVGRPAIRAYYAELFARLPAAVFMLSETARQDDLRTLRWTAASPAGNVPDGQDLIGMVNGRIQYHYSAYTLPR